MKSVTLILIITALFGPFVDGISYKRINDGASTSLAKDELTDEEKREIEYLVDQYISKFVVNFVHYESFLADKREERHNYKSKNPTLVSYRNFEKSANVFLKYGNDNSTKNNYTKLTNQKARVKYYESIKEEKIFFTITEVPHCSGIIPLESILSTTTPSTTTIKPKKDSMFKRWYKKLARCVHTTKSSL